MGPSSEEEELILEAGISTGYLNSRRDKNNKIEIGKGSFGQVFAVGWVEGNLTSKLALKVIETSSKRN